MMASRPGLDEIMLAVADLQMGRRAKARLALRQLWAKWSEQDAPLQRCTIAHFLADTEDDPAAELVWDLRALEAATCFDDEQDRNAIDPDLANFLPSLHLNVGDAYRRVGDRQRAQSHAENGIRRASALQDDGYGNMVKGGLARLQDQLAIDS